MSTETTSTTAVNPDAPLILQWDRPEERNPVSWYVWMGGSYARSFGLRADEFHDVEAVTFQPSMWHGSNEHQGKGVIFVIAGARESRQSGAALFPEILRSELHGVRSVIEAYSYRAMIEGMGEPHAVGLMAQASQKNAWNISLRVWSGGRS
jgi:hypothetical protein